MSTSPVVEAFRTLQTPGDAGLYMAAWALDFPMAGEPRLRVLEDLRLASERPLSPDEMILWFCAPRTSLLPESAAEVLGDTLAEEAARFHEAADRASFIAAHAGARLMLAPLLHCMPAQVAYLRDGYGKPRLCLRRHGQAAAAIHFSISHTRGLVAAAVAGRPVGVDVERIRPLADWERIAELAFAPETLATLRATPEARRTRIFYRHWTLGEAFVKATGLGIGLGLSTFAFTSQGQARLTRATPGWGPASRWRFGLFS